MVSTPSTARPARGIAPACLLGLALAAAVLPGHAHAADADDAASDSGDTGSEGHGRAPIVVKGHAPAVNPNAHAGTPYKVDRSQDDKLTEALRDTPRTVVAVPKEVIADMGANSLREVVRAMPGVTLGTGEGGNAFGDRIFIRGFEARNDVYIDGLRDPGVTSREIYAVEQIEVIKGPSGQFGGRGTTGGLVSLQSKRPDFMTDFLQVEQGVGTDNAYRTTFDLNRHLADNLVVRANGLYHTADTPGRDHVWQRRYGGSLSLAWRATDRFSVTADIYTLRSQGIPDFGVPFDTVTQQPYKVAQGNYYGVIGRDFLDTGANVGTLRLEWRPVDGLKLRSTTRYGHTWNHYVVGNPGSVCRYARTSAGACPTTGTDVGEANYTVSVGTQRRWSENEMFANVTDATADFTTGAFAHTLVMGGEYSRETIRNYPLSVATSGEDTSGNIISTPTVIVRNLLNPNPVLGYTIPVTVDNVTGPARSVIDTLAFYAIDTIKLGSHWAATLGARYDSYVIDYRSSSLANATVLRSNAGFWNGQASLTYKPVEPVSLYVSWATSSNPSGEQTDGTNAAYGGLAATTANLAPERNKSWEAGAKWEVGHGDLLLTAAAFEITKDNAREQVSDGTYQLVGKLRSRGAEVGVSGELWDKLNLFGGYTYTDAKIIASATAANVGRRFANIPVHSANLLATWNFTHNFELGGQVHWQSTVYGGSSAAGNAHIPAYARFDIVARAKLNSRVEARLNINNVTNKLYYDAIYRSAQPFAYVAPGRSAMVSVKVSM